MADAITHPEYYIRDFGNFPLSRRMLTAKHIWEVLSEKDKSLENYFTKGDPDTYLNKDDKVSVSAGNVVIMEDTIIKPFTVIEGPVIIGRNCVIGPHAYIRAGTAIGNNVKVGRAEIKNSIIFDEVQLHHHGYVGDSIIGRGVNIGSSFDSGNLKHSEGNVRIGKYDTMLKKFGCVIGDYSRVGCKTTTVPGTLVGPNVWLDSGSMVSGFVQENIFRKRTPLGSYVDEPLREEYRRMLTKQDH